MSASLTRVAIAAAFCPVFVPTAVSAADEPAQVEIFRAVDTLNVGEDSSPDARAFLQKLEWKPTQFDVTCSDKPLTMYDRLVRFPSPAPSGDAANDSVSMEWYATGDDDGKRIKAPAVVVVHESGSNMPVGKLFARSLRDQGLHAFMLHLPYYGRRRTGDQRPDRWCRWYDRRSSMCVGRAMPWPRCPT